MTKRVPLLLVTALFLPALPGCHSNPQNKTLPNTLQIHSQMFSAVNAIPAQFTCDGADISPPLSWEAPPAQTKSLALIVFDRSTPSYFTHWQIYNLPPGTRSLAQGIPSEAQLPSGARQTENNFGKIGYGGPCPPRQGASHDYNFELFALNTTLNLPKDTNQHQLRAAMKGHILAEGHLVATYHHNSHLSGKSQ